jgi:hypothetical protein
MDVIMKMDDGEFIMSSAKLLKVGGWFLLFILVNQ